jgi:integrase
MSEISVPTSEQVVALEEAARRVGRGTTAMFPEAIVFAAYTGVRLSELLALEWSDVDGDELHVTKQRRRDGGTAPPKRGSSGTVLMLSPARAAIEGMSDGSRERIFDWSHREHTRIWGETRDVAAAGVDLLEAEAFAGIRWHDLRHYCATYLLDRGVSDLDVSLQLRHGDGGDLVRKTYGHASPRMARDRMRDALAAWTRTDPETLKV